jgi:hypothetical protein
MKKIIEKIKEKIRNIKYGIEYKRMKRREKKMWELSTKPLTKKK